MLNRVNSCLPRSPESGALRCRLYTLFPLPMRESGEGVGLSQEAVGLAPLSRQPVHRAGSSLGSGAAAKAAVQSTAVEGGAGARTGATIAAQQQGVAEKQALVSVSPVRHVACGFTGRRPSWTSCAASSPGAMAASTAAS